MPGNTDFVESGLGRKIYNEAASLESYAVRILSDLVRAKSLSCKEQRVVDVIRAEMNAIGFDEVFTDGLGSIVGRIGNGGFKLAFDAHIDTVDAGDTDQWETEPFEPVLKEGRLYGRGSVDQKAGMAAMLCASKVIRSLGLERDITLYFTGTVMEEDCDGLCWDHLIAEEGLKPDLVVITEPTDLNIYRGQRGRMEIRLAIRGRSSHGSMPDLGDNASYKAAGIALEIEKLNQRLAKDDFLGKGTVAVTELTSTAPSLCAVPDSAWLHLDRRLTKGETKESALAEIERILESLGLSSDVTVQVPLYEAKAYTGKSYPREKYFPSWVLEPESKWLETAKLAYRSVLEKEPEISRWTFSTNGVSIAGRHSIPCLGMGPGEEALSHAPNESCPVDHLVKAAAFYAGLAALLGGH